MTEAEWLASDDPVAMLEALKQGEPCAGRTQEQVDRRMRLWVEACRLRWPDIAGSTDLTDQTRLRQACEQWAATHLHAPASEIASILRDIVGNPFTAPALRHPVPWIVTNLALAAYDERREDGALDADRLKVLCDAVEEAEVAGQAVVAHLRSPGPHVRGCWVIDLILGKA